MFDPPASLVGVAIACAGNILISGALTVQKLAHRRQEHAVRPGYLSSGTEESLLGSEHAPTNGVQTLVAHPLVELGDESPRERVEEGAYLRSKLWWLGLAMMAIGEMGNFVSYGFAPASVVAPLGTVALIANCVFAPLVLGESFTKRNVLGIVLAILGGVTIVWASGGKNPRLSPSQLLQALLALPFLIHTAVTVALIGILVFLSSGPLGEQHVVIDVATCALFGGYTVMATKALSSLLSSSPLSVFREPVAWGAVVILVVTSVLQIKFLNRALMRFESKMVIPTQFVFFTMSAIIGSAVLYQEFRGITLSRMVNFIFGISTTFLGVYFLTTPDSLPTEVDEATPLLVPPMPDRRPSAQPVLGVNKRSSVPNLRLSSSNNVGLGFSSGGMMLLATTPPKHAPTLTPRGSLGNMRGQLASARARSDSRSSARSAHRVGSPLTETAFPRRHREES